MPEGNLPLKQGWYFRAFALNLGGMFRALRVMAPWIGAALLWLWLFLHLQVEWTLNPQYNYGWAVPFLALLLFYLRWQRRPGPDLRSQNNALITVAMAFALALLFPIRVIEEANPDWRLLSWILAFCVVDFSLLSLIRAGGARWVRHFAFPILFPLTAVPWPVQFESFVVQTMMRVVAFLAVEIAGWFGVGAYQLGNVIQLRNGFVGVDEACSGVKTLQAGIMVSLVLGELFQLRWSRRIALVVLGCGWVFVCNVFRATALVFVAAKSGLDALGRWHDTIGMAALLCGMAGMLALAWVWKGEPRREQSPSPSAGTARVFPAQWGVFGWVLVIFAATEIWYRSHERQLIEQPPWQVTWPAANQTVTALPIPDSTRVILHYDEAKTAAWEEPAGIHWWTFFARWKPERAALQLVRSHSPKICLPAIGRTFVGFRSEVKVEAESIALDFRSYEFEQNGRPLFVFVCIQEDKRVVSTATETGEWNLEGRLRAAWVGKRNLGQRLLEIAVSGVDDFGQASEALSKTAREILRPERTIR
jgi:exosortase